MSFYAQYDEALGDDELALVRRARDFAEAHLAPAALDAYAGNEPIDRGVIERWASTGMLGLQVAREQGGYGASYLCKIRVAQELAAHGFAAAFCLNNMQGIATRVDQHGSEALKAEFLAGLRKGELIAAPSMSEPQAGSDLAKLSTRAEPVEGGWILNGTKAWITSGTLVHCITLLAQTPYGGKDAIAGFMVRCEGDTLRRSEMLVPGARSFRLAQLEFTDHFVPASALLYAPGEAFKRSMKAINGARVHVAAMCVGALYGAFRTAVQYCAGRVAFDRPVLEHQGLRWDLAEVAARMEAANALVFRAAQLIQRGEDNPSLCAQAKIFAVDCAISGIQDCMQAMGAIGGSALYPVAMQLAEVRMAYYADGTSEMLKDRSGRDLLTNYLRTGAN